MGRYVHADLHGASSTVIKNHNPLNPVPPLTINQAGLFTVSLSIPFLSVLWKRVCVRPLWLVLSIFLDIFDLCYMVFK